MKRLVIVVLVLFVGGLWRGAGVMAQEGADNACRVMESVWQTAAEACPDLAGDTVCIGAGPVDGSLRLSASELPFAADGDVVDAVDVTALRLGALDSDSGTMGVVLARIQADLRFDAGEPVALVAFGEVTLTPGEPVPPFFGVTVSGTVNLRQMPTTRANVVGQITPGQSLVTDGRLADSSWLRVQLNGGYAWVFADLVSPMGDVATLDVVDPEEPLMFYGPMQAFYLTTGVESAACQSSPDSGLLIQGPADTPITLLINEVLVRITDTAYVQAPEGEAVRVCALQGWASVEAFNRAALAYNGACVQVPLTGELAPAGPPDQPESYAPEAFATLPEVLLNHPVTAAMPLEQAEVALLGVLPRSGQWVMHYAPATLTCAGSFGGPVDMSGVGGARTIAFALDGTSASILDQRGMPQDTYLRVGPGKFVRQAGADDVEMVTWTIVNESLFNGLVVRQFPNDCVVEAPFELVFSGG